MWRHRAVLIRGWPYSKGHRGKLTAMGICTVLAALLPLASPWPIAFLIDNVVGETPYPGPLAWLDDADPVTQILVAVGFMLAIDLAAHGVSILSQWLEVRFELNVVRDMRSAMFRHVQRLPLAFLDQQRAGMFIYYINYQAHSMGSLITTTLPLVQMLITVVGALAITWWISPTLALIAMATIPFIVVSTTLYNRYVEPTLLRVRNLEGGSLSIVHESIAMMRVVVAYCREEFEYRVFRRNAESSINARVVLTMRQAVFIALVSVITALGTAAAVGYSAWLIMNGNTSVGSLLVVMSYMTRVYQPLEQLSTTIAGVQEQFINLKLCFEVLDQPIEVDDAPDAHPLPPVRGAVDVEDVVFEYRNGRRALDGVSFTVEPGQKVAVVGPTGAGKTTLMHLLPRFADPTSGRVRIDGHDLRAVTRESLRTQVAIVGQEPMLFGRTIEENIRYGRPDATRAEVVEAARAANAHEFILMQPDGYDTRLAERGGGLSGGEKQRLTIARAFLKDAPILVLDEPTSSIDSRTEAVILDALDRLSRGRTTFVIAHRLSTVADADLILVVADGRIVQRGTHDALLAAEGVYREMWAAQTGVRRQRDAGSDGPAPLQVLLAQPRSEAARAEEVDAEIDHIAHEAVEDASLLFHPEPMLEARIAEAAANGNGQTATGQTANGNGQTATGQTANGNGSHAQRNGADGGHADGDAGPPAAPPEPAPHEPAPHDDEAARALADAGVLHHLLERDR